MRGALSYINKRYNEAFKNVNILYLEIDNLYGCDYLLAPEKINISKNGHLIIV